MQLPEYRTRAVNTAAEHENRIHSDEVGARYGFRGGLVPGVNIYGNLTVPVVRHFGEDWLRRGWMRVRFREPFYEQEEVVVESSVQPDGSIRADCGKASGEAGIAKAPQPALPAEAALPRVRAEIWSDGVAAPAVLGSYEKTLSDELAQKLGDPLSCYRTFVHPAELLGLANDILVRNFVLPAWIHVASEVQCFEAALVGRKVCVRGNIRETFERKGHQFLLADVAVISESEEWLMHVSHTAIWKPRPVRE